MCVEIKIQNATRRSTKETRKNIEPISTTSNKNNNNKKL